LSRLERPVFLRVAAAVECKCGSQRGALRQDSPQDRRQPVPTLLSIWRSTRPCWPWAVPSPSGPRARRHRHPRSLDERVHDLSAGSTHGGEQRVLLLTDLRIGIGSVMTRVADDLRADVLDQAGRPGDGPWRSRGESSKVTRGQDYRLTLGIATMCLPARVTHRCDSRASAIDATAL
jgi:hypothetical protein